jgi:molybdenum-dependent DNA-binding transcriptional regulator ModE
METPLKSGLYGHKGSIKVIIIITMEEFESIKDAAKSIGVKYNHLSEMLLGKRTNTSNIRYWK